MSDDIARTIEAYVLYRNLEFQIGRGPTGNFEVRVRGHDPTGAYHEESYVNMTEEDGSMLNTMRLAAETFCTAYGIV